MLRKNTFRYAMLAVMSLSITATPSRLLAQQVPAPASSGTPASVRVGIDGRASLVEGRVVRTTSDSIVVQSGTESRAFLRTNVTQFFVRTGRISMQEVRERRARTAFVAGGAVTAAAVGTAGIGCAFNRSRAAGDLNTCKVMRTGAFLGGVATLAAVGLAYLKTASEQDRWEAASPITWQVSVGGPSGFRGGPSPGIGLRIGF